MSPAILHSRVPPFSSKSSLSPAKEWIYPACFRYEGMLLDPQQAPQLFLESDLHMPKLNAIYHRLWLAGPIRQARPLHRQKLMQRTIHLTESVDEHLVWSKDHIFIKPIPGYLLNYELWEEFLCPSEQQFAGATGLLLSYVWLVASPIDFAIAIEERIFPPSITWVAWRNVVHDILRDMDTVTAQADQRYHYGELRLSRLNTLYRFNLATFSARDFVYGFMSNPTCYTQFFERNFGWIVAAFIYITVILSAMQVGLATSRLENNVSFQNVSYGVAVMSIVVVLVVAVSMLAVWFVLFWFHLCSTIRHSKRELVKRSTMRRNV
ncbi:hypothetical protein HBH56_061200 [Parastagonospora nodorum]|uniref:Subtilisin-like serine protease n=1 Tax=Phaeosphaeria nodorum (strain SN15 / ATCC MYA-4574 / FGSC 10173) TaxID=321614 RepID=A0A7U2EVS2_PHANO|nr:hypothetical protein HBH56_061200 [Parastagonospora nodorum]QRC91954.1 hypothetical protein JI435_427560 [Parastagonospora nodorum SN15]KAH3931090.1 hypothetical protein HBH54_105140 [Parastagonospora nodorum]KAH3968256.1 hypothetical protein HBH51_133640 [Parastagonospora nodorum]KAH3999974.1 hypothetical protein HBI10_107540 [Parastagonospora nodorum]